MWNHLLFLINMLGTDTENSTQGGYEQIYGATALQLNFFINLNALLTEDIRL